MSISLSVALNATQQFEVLNVLHDFTAANAVPMVLIESFLFGVCSGTVLLINHLLWLQKKRRIDFLLLLWVLYALFATHLALSIRHFLRLASGSSIGLPLSDQQISVLESTESFGIADTFLTYEALWEIAVPLIVETTLFGLSTLLLAIAIRVTFTRRDNYPHRQSPASFFIPITAAVMYALSISHWAVSVAFYSDVAGNISGNSALRHTHNGLKLSLAAILMINTLLSDAIVLWRMCIIWDKARFAIVLSALFFVVTAALVVTNLVYLGSGYNFLSSVDVDVYSGVQPDTMGVPVAFLSLFSNLTATALVITKACLHRKRLAALSYSSHRRTLVEHVMEVAIDSGLVYTAIWILYTASVFGAVSGTNVVPDYTQTAYQEISAVDYLNAALAQLTTIYPLIIFILVALSKEHCGSGSDLPHKLPGGSDLRTVSIELHANRLAAPFPETPDGDDSREVTVQPKGSQ